MRHRLTLFSLLAIGATSALYAFGDGMGPPDGRRPGGPRPGTLDSTSAGRRPPRLTAEQQTLAIADRDLRDSLHQAIGTYSSSVRKGADPRTLVLDRARINDYATRLERLRTTNLDLWLDVVALRPMAFHGPRGPRASHDSLPPPPRDLDGDSTDAP